MTQQHAELSGSSAHRWISCPGSVKLCRPMKRTSSPAAQEGTFAHSVAEHILKNGDIKPGHTLRYEDHGEPMVKCVEPEMLEHVMTYVTEIRKTPGRLYLEMHVDLRGLVRDGMWGTADAVNDDSGLGATLTVTDFKYGFTPVRLVNEAGDINPQLLYYASGALDYFKWKHDMVVLKIVQPRCMEVPPVQVEYLPAKSVRQWATTTLWVAAHATDDPAAPLVPGDHCRFCPALAVCPAVQRQSQELAGQDFRELVGHPKDQTVRWPEPPYGDSLSLSQILKAAPVIDAWLRACEAAAQAELERGHEVPGFKLVAKRANRQWPEGVPDQIVIRNLKTAGLKVGNVVDDCYTTPELLSPAQMEKLPGGKVAVNKVAIKPDAGVTLAAESDRRPAVTANDFEELL